MGMFSDQFERVMSDVQGAMDEELEEAVLPEAQRRVPVRTGKLKASLDVGTERDGAVITGYVEAGEPYAPYPEFGTQFQPAKPYLRPSAEKFDLQRVADRMPKGDA
ncbi:TP901-1 ORF40 family protein [Solidesulfovibrio fructosivorans JJ]]|uniref:TP901-1 ORF40 family protein n=1 Tax=Solidesulfovibrio fructosivorans JJ] TaxID=596151 RepID=E1JR06_SOLFR|nr:HK97-gp10 family putative phage morphogenesis protein [Solidesulfovibrio fructosivorans]EFL53007.1 TP901-1 ORF40 family protein [Solidesulfovibrio fructosivorans JJ]]